jgi:hypothetical protein
METDNEYYVNRRKGEQKAKGESGANAVENPVDHSAHPLRLHAITFNCGLCHTIGAYATYNKPAIHIFCPSCGSRITPKRVIPDPDKPRPAR